MSFAGASSRTPEAPLHIFSIRNSQSEIRNSLQAPPPAVFSPNWRARVPAPQLNRPPNGPPSGVRQPCCRSFLAGVPFRGSAFSREQAPALRRHPFTSFQSAIRNPQFAILSRQPPPAVFSPNWRARVPAPRVKGTHRATATALPPGWTRFRPLSAAHPLRGR